MRAVTVRRRLPWPRDVVFHAWTDPDALAQWFGGPDASTLTASVDLRVGGVFRITVQAGPDVRAVEGVYRQVDAPRALVHTWRWDVPASAESLVTVTFDEDGGGGTEVTVRHARLESMASVVFHQGGWGASLEQLHETLAGSLAR
jgi:uncharacterized protein YndB with AHSA1/START domain